VHCGPAVARMAVLAARVAELADAQDLGSCAERRAGSSPASRNSLNKNDLQTNYS
jgi:hypothetical protein